MLILSCSLKSCNFFLFFQLHRMQDEQERLRANPLLYLLNPNVKVFVSWYTSHQHFRNNNKITILICQFQNWLSRQKFMILVMLINLALAIMFLQLLTWKLLYVSCTPTLTVMNMGKKSARFNIGLQSLRWTTHEDLLAKLVHLSLRRAGLTPEASSRYSKLNHDRNEPNWKETKNIFTTDCWFTNII